MPNDLFAKLQADFEAALERETSLRVSYETSLIPQLERDLQACRRDLEATIAERDRLAAWKKRSLIAFEKVEEAKYSLDAAFDLAPGEPPLG